MRTTLVGVHRIPTTGPGDVSGLLRLIAPAGPIDPKSIVAVLGKTENRVATYLRSGVVRVRQASLLPSATTWS